MSGDASHRDVDVDGSLEKACGVFGLSKLSPQQKRRKGFYLQERCLGKLANGVWQLVDIPDDSVVHAELSQFNNTFVAKSVAIVISPLASLILGLHVTS